MSVRTRAVRGCGRKGRATDGPRRLPRGGESSQHRDHRARGPRQDHAGGRDAVAERDVPREPGRARAGAGLHGPGAREGHHDHGEERLRDLPRRQDQHRRHAGSRGFRGRGGTHAADGRRCHAARRRRGGAHAPDPRGAGQGAGAGAAADRGHQQDRPPRRAPGGSPERDLRPFHRPGRHRGTDRVPGHLLGGPAGKMHAVAGRRVDRSPAAVRGHPRARSAARRGAGPPLADTGHQRGARRLPRTAGHRPGGGRHGAEPAAGDPVPA